ncbi:MAG: non-homologous end-joining DNA ligase [Planctomycetes bacterium]|nr:non-homologous end-joining DNA ligase [Planctomycetota bacterium]
MPDELSIDDYRRKRDFAKTPEPAPESGRERTGPPVFVIHRHEARRLHYDLRLEMDGVLKSWAVPKGFSFDPSDKHLAVRTEDHPIEYEDFDGVIPKGQYGAGTMTIWDKGTFELAKGNDDHLAALAEGKLEVRLFGHRLRGEWHMVKTNRDEKDWLLFKYRDRYARPKGEPLFPLDLADAPRAPMPARPRARRAETEREPFSDAEWVFELEFDGLRLLVRKSGDELRFLDRDGKALKIELGSVTHELRRLRVEDAVLDGVLVALDANGRPDRRRLDRCLRTGETGALTLYLFDLLHYEEWRLDRVPLIDRKRALRSLIPSEFGQVLYVDHVAERGEELFDVVRSGGLRGVIAKRAQSGLGRKAADAWIRISAPDDSAAKRSNLLTKLAKSAGTRKIRARVQLTNPQKVYWPNEGITKGQLLDYYDRIADTILPYLRDRPLHLRRFPEGIDGQHFYHKNLTHQVPDWVATAKVKDDEQGEEVRYVMCNDRDTLLYLVNLGSIDLHPWMSRADALLEPDYGVLDLDPAGKEFGPQVVVLARTIGKVLRGAGVEPLLKTSGASGMHIVIPVVRRYTYEQVRTFCEIVARWVVREHRDIATVERSVAQRQGKVYIDFMQNFRGQTVVPPYVVRPVPGATVSTPLDWDELQGDIHPSRFTMFDLPRRLEERGDLFRPLLTNPYDLAPVLAALSENFE